jgi:3'(2'), 5'-bisphosphate nucleotidase
MALIESVAELLRGLGSKLLSWRGSGGTDGTWDGPHFHAKADLWAHQHILTGLAQLQTGLPIVSEEGRPDEQAGADRYWLVDPIDGTASYAQGFAGFVTQVALMDHERPVLAVVFAPQSGELFVAEKGSGAFRNGIRLELPRSSPALTLIDNYPAPHGLAADLYDDLSFTAYVESGSTGLKICRVADGTADALFKDCGLRDWDIAAPHLVLAEAGGCLVDGVGNAIHYGAPRRQPGVVAARDGQLCEAVASWHRVRLLRPTAERGDRIPQQP